MYQGERNVSFAEKFAYILNEGPSAGVTTGRNACDGFKFLKPRVYTIITILTILIFA